MSSCEDEFSFEGCNYFPSYGEFYAYLDRILSPALIQSLDFSISAEFFFAYFYITVSYRLDLSVLAAYLERMVSEVSFLNGLSMVLNMDLGLNYNN